MPPIDAAPANSEVVCPICKGPVRFARTGTYGGQRLHAEMHVFECPEHGAVFLTREGMPGPGPDSAPEVDGGDAPVRSPRDGSPSPIGGATAQPDPESD